MSGIILNLESLIKDYLSTNCRSSFKLYEQIFTNEGISFRAELFITSEKFRETFSLLGLLCVISEFKSSRKCKNKMLRQLQPRVIRKITLSRRLSTALQQQTVESEYSEVAEYPPIIDDEYRAKRSRRYLEWHEKIKKIGTIEEKLIEINMPRYYGYKCLMLDEKTFPYNTLPFFKYVTNTELVELETFKPNENEVKNIDNFLQLIKSDFADALEFELDGYV